jgi:hypothetical protein
MWTRFKKMIEEAIANPPKRAPKKKKSSNGIIVLR